MKEINYINTMRSLRGATFEPEGRADNQYYLDEKGRQFDEDLKNGGCMCHWGDYECCYTSVDYCSSGKDIFDDGEMSPEEKAEYDRYDDTAFCSKTGLHYDSAAYQYLEAKDDDYYSYLETKAREEEKNDVDDDLYMNMVLEQEKIIDLIESNRME